MPAAAAVRHTRPFTPVRTTASITAPRSIPRRLDDHRCAVDPVRIELDGRIVTDLLGLDDQALATITRLRTLLAADPSIHGAKRPDLPS